MNDHFTSQAQLASPLTGEDQKKNIDSIDGIQTGLHLVTREREHWG